MSFWADASFAFEAQKADKINEEIWALSAGIQRDELPNSGDHGALQAMLDPSILGPEARGLVLPWVPDVLGAEWDHPKAVHIVGSAYAGFIEGLSDRHLKFEDYWRTSKSRWEDFAKVYLSDVIRGDTAYYERLGPILKAFAGQSRFSLFDLCRASLVTRKPKQGGYGYPPIKLKGTVSAQKVFDSHASHRKSKEWTWSRLQHSEGTVIALGFTAEYGLLRIFKEKHCRIVDSIEGEYKPGTHRNNLAWTVNYADKKRKIGSRLEFGAYWNVEYGERKWKLIPIYHPQNRAEDPGYRNTLKFLSNSI